jgi:hypothetical protein
MFVCFFIRRNVVLTIPSVKLPKSFIAINLSEISPQLFGPIRKDSSSSVFEMDGNDGAVTGPPFEPETRERAAVEIGEEAPEQKADDNDEIFSVDTSENGLEI